MYGKGTGHGVTTFVDKGEKTGKGVELKDMNSNAIKDRKDGGQTNEGFVGAEEPPFTNFKGEVFITDNHCNYIAILQF